MKQNLPPTTFREALAQIGHSPSPGMDMVAATAVLYGTPPEEALRADMLTITRAGAVALLTFNIAAMTSPPLHPNALDEDALLQCARDATPDQILRLISAHMTQEQADAWLDNAESMLASVQEGARNADQAYRITGSLKGAALLSVQQFRERIKREGATVNPSTEHMIRQLESFARLD